MTDRVRELRREVRGLERAGELTKERWLAIAKRAIELSGGDLAAASTVGVRVPRAWMNEAGLPWSIVGDLDKWRDGPDSLFTIIGRDMGLLDDLGLLSQEEWTELLREAEERVGFEHPEFSVFAVPAFDHPDWIKAAGYEP